MKELQIWYMPLIPALREAKAGRLQVQGQPGYPAKSYLKLKIKDHPYLKRGSECSLTISPCQEAEVLPMGKSCSLP